jgi:hypothetical protein
LLLAFEVEQIGEENQFQLVSYQGELKLSLQILNYTHDRFLVVGFEPLDLVWVGCKSIDLAPVAVLLLLILLEVDCMQLAYCKTYL